jgi:hypothetical protein
MLKNQLEDLITAKTTHEAELLRKFCLILNEKKAKIRDQQRLLASAKVDLAKVRAVQTGEMPVMAKKVKESRPGKRKARLEREVSTDGDEREPGFESMDMDIDQVLDDSDREGAMTPDEDEETADDDDEEQSLPVKAPTRPTHQTTGEKGTGAGPNIAQAVKSPSRSTAPITAGERQEESKSPPRRQLPFPKKQVVPAATTADLPIMNDNEGSETASEDDELWPRKV